MNPGGEIFNRRRRHNNTPKAVLLIINNYVVCCALFTLITKSNWFFWVVLLLLGVYNYFNIRRNREEYNRANIIAYAVSLVGIVLLYFVARMAL